MSSTAQIVYRLTELNLPALERQRSLHDFAQAAGWYPSDELVEYPGTEDFANGHLLVEHGMANTAVISFLKPDCDFTVLNRTSQLRLLELSYNNLVDWHLLPNPRGLTAIYNRTDPPRDFRFTDKDAWRADAFAQISGAKVRPELKALDDAFISTVSYWKRAIASELRTAISNEHLSALFSSLIFIRAFEDHTRRLGNPNIYRLLPTLATSTPTIPISEICSTAISQLGSQSIPQFIREQLKTLTVFDSLDPELVQQLTLDFYTNKYSPYSYDFSLISKHALSRIYEHYVSVLRSEESDQRELFPSMPDEASNKTLGSYYTPQYIARFFARYVQEHTPPKEFREMSVIDPACGSGIFLRTIQEIRCDPLNSLARSAIKQSFLNVTGLDVDKSACEAAKLSLSLLHLVLTDEFPESLNIQARDAIEFVRSEATNHATYGAVVANPPYIRWESQSEEWKEEASSYLGDLAIGKVDAYAAVLKAGLDLVGTNGFAMFVLPHTFLHSRSTEKLRVHIAESFWIRLIADLSDIRVFEDVGAYTILVILQRKQPSASPPLATVVKCRQDVGEALSTALRGRLADNEHYRVFETTQNSFAEESWNLHPPKQQAVIDQLNRLPRLDSVAKLSQGVVTGADNVFIRLAIDVPKSERAVWRPLLSDREMTPYSVPKKTERVVFYPIIGQEKLSEADLSKGYPDSWAYLQSHKAKLSSRKSLEKEGTSWWRPLWPRDPKLLFSPKIVCPHLMLTPRFAIDLKGSYAVTRSPFITPNDQFKAIGDDLYKYLVAILNSNIGFWQISSHSHKLGRQYTMVENKALNAFKIPDPRLVHPRVMREIVTLVNKRMQDGFTPALESQIDALVAEAYALDENDLKAIGIE